MDKRTRLRFELIAAFAGVVFVPTYPIAWAWIGPGCDGRPRPSVY